MIEARDLVKHYGALEAIRGVSFEVRSGEIVGLLGPNGAGKSTIMKILTCYHLPTSGSAVVDSHDVVRRPLEVRRSVGYLPESAPVYRDLKVVEYLDYVAEVRGFARNERIAMVERAMALCGLDSMGYRTIDKLSKGYRQRVGLAQAIIHDPPTLILDEPTSGLDPNQIAEIRTLIRGLGRKKTVILSTHLLQEVENLCARILVLNEGFIVARGTSSELAGAVGGTRTVVSLSLQDAPREEVARALEGLPEGASTAVPPAAGDGGRVILEITLESGVGEGSLFSWAVDHGLTIVAMANHTLDLEQIFHTLTRGRAGDA